MVLDTARLEGRLQFLREQVSSQCPVLDGSSAVARCAAYWSAFAHGYDPYRAAYQIAVVTSTMTPDVESMGVVGVEHIVASWRRHVSSFIAFSKVATAWRVAAVDGTTTVVRGDGTIAMRLTRAGVAHFFPHVSNNEAMNQLLIGRELCLPCTQIFYLSLQGDGRLMVHRLETLWNVALALTNALGSLQQVAEYTLTTKYRGHLH
ncbi:hypothetical protein ACHHYP_06865 [Achlya hypogyna]|uniref:Bzip transcription factor n=1 Tax=Achlya hypogyna TaxID=1202772 RepID=A0A1V9YRE2_ACHHY|nr:hypothetical protein ACHHYP_06865 [Achlya hypogyna]